VAGSRASAQVACFEVVQLRGKDCISLYTKNLTGDDEYLAPCDQLRRPERPEPQGIAVRRTRTYIWKEGRAGQLSPQPPSGEWIRGRDFIALVGRYPQGKSKGRSHVFLSGLVGGGIAPASEVRSALLSEVVSAAVT
jgi:hypothetical protein